MTLAFSRERQTLFRFFVRRVLAARTAKLFGLEAVRMLFLIFGGGVIAIFAITTLQRNDFPHELIPFPILFRNTPSPKSLRVNVTR
jgi:hypothetical protein